MTKMIVYGPGFGGWHVETGAAQTTVAETLATGGVLRAVIADDPGGIPVGSSVLLNASNVTAVIFPKED